MSEAAIVEENVAEDATESTFAATESTEGSTQATTSETAETPSGGQETPTEAVRPAWLQDVLSYRPEVPGEEPATPAPPGAPPDFGDTSLDQFTIDKIKELVAMETATREAKLREEIGATRTEAKQHRAAEVEKSLVRTRDFLDNHFYPSVLANDPDVMGSKEVRGYVDFFAGKFTEQAVQIARQYGDTGRAEFIESPIFQALVVGGAKELHRIVSGKKSGTTSIDKPVTPKGAHTETSASPAGESGIKLDKETRAWLKERGISEADHIKDLQEFGSDVAYDGD